MKVLVSLFAATAALAGAASAQPVKDGDVFGDWKVTCAAGNPCQAFLGLKDDRTGRLVLSASTYKAAGDKHPTLLLSLPLGLSLKDGVALLSSASGEAAIPARLDVCFPDGCRAVIELTPATLNALTAAKTFEVRFIAYGVKDRVESVKVPATGLKDAVARLAQ